MVGAQNTHIPLKLAMAGVMPIIFASSFMTFPAMIIQMFVPNIAAQTGFWAAVYKFSIATSTSAVPLGYTIANAIVYLLLIVGFTFFYTYATFNPAEVSNNIKKMVDSYQELEQESQQQIIYHQYYLSYYGLEDYS